jgi:hypothetical protein
MGARFALFLAFLVVAPAAHAFRDDLPLDPAVDCVKPGPGAAWRQACALAAIERACATDPQSIPGAVAHALGVHSLLVMKAMGRHTLASLERGDLCARGESERRQVVEAALVPKKVHSESPMNWWLEQLTMPDGTIDHAAVARAVKQREALLASAKAKRAGLPTAPSLGWQNLTGYTQSAGRINHVLFTSATGNDILAGSDGGGIWRSTDAGASWAPVNDFLGSLTITNFARSDNDASTLYAATNARGSHTYFPFGIFKSIDGGASWSQLPATNPSANVDFAYVQRVAVHPTNSSVVLAATEGGAYLSGDAGGTWTRVGPATRAYWVAFHPADGNRRAVAYDDGTVRYTTTGDLAGAGASTATVLGGAGSHYPKIAYAKTDPARMYALVNDPLNGTTHLFMSTTSGASWVENTNLPSGAIGTLYNNSYLFFTGGIWVDPTNPNRIGLFEGWAWSTADITTVTPGSWSRLYSGWTDFHGMVEHPGYNGSTNKQVFLMDDGGLYRASDVDAFGTGANFARLDTGMAVTQVYSVSGYRGNPIIGAQDVAPKVFRTDPSDPPLKWRFVNRTAGGAWIGDGATTAASTANPQVLYGSRQYMDVFRSNDGGVTGASIVTGSTLADANLSTKAGFIAPFVLDPSNQSRMLAGGTSLWRSNDVDTGNPPAWTAIHAPFVDCSGEARITAIAIAPSNPDVVWIAHDSCQAAVFKSVNATQPNPTWTLVTTLPASFSNYYKTAITIDRYDPDKVWIGFAYYLSTTLLKTVDGGATPGGWSVVTGLPGAPVYALTQHPASTTWLYAATGVGLFSSNDAGATWSGSNEGPANVVVKSLAWNTTGAVSELLVGTYGRGVWKAKIAMPRTDLGGDNRSDLLYRNGSTGQVYRMFMNGFAITSGAMAYTEPNTAWKVIADADFNGDGVSDLLWRNSTTGQVFLQPFAATGLPNGGAVFYTEPNAAWRILFTPDLDGDGKADLLWYNTSTGQVYAMLMNGAAIRSQGMVYTEPNLAWSIAAVGDFSGSGRTNQLLWRHSATGQVYLMTMAYSAGAFSQTGAMIYQEPNTAWKILAAPDFDGDGRSDILWRNDSTGQVYAMLMKGAAISTAAFIYTEPNLAWKIVAQGDYNGDGRSDLLYRNEATGQLFMVPMTGLAAGSGAMVYSEPNLSWKVLGPYEYAQ